MSEWISAQAAFGHVVSHEVSPEFAYDKIMAAIMDRKLPTRARMVNFDGEDAEVAVLPMSFWEATDVSIDFDKATAISINVWSSSTAIDNVRDLEFSEKHFRKLWSGQSDKGEKRLSPKRRSVEEAVIDLFGSIEASGKIPTGLRDRKIMAWLKAKDRAAVDAKTIQRALKTKKDK